MIFSLVALTSLVFASSGCQRHIATVIMERRVHAMKVPRDHPTHMNYLAQLPRGYREDTNRFWPMVFYLHGLGEGGYNLDKVLRFGPQRWWPKEKSCHASW
jgi:predicted peptidase